MFRLFAFAATLLLVSTTAFAGPNSAPTRLILQCTVTDETDQQRNDYAPGESFRYNVYINVPPSRAGQKVLINGLATGNVLGFPLSLQLPTVDVAIPNQAARDQIPGWNPAIDQEIAAGIEVRRSSGLITIPQAFPNTNLRIRLSARFAPDADFEADVQCDKQVRVRNTSGS